MYVGEVIKKTSVIGEFFPEEAQRVNNALSRLRHRDVPTFLSDTDCCQPKSRGGNAGDYAVVNRADIAPVFHHAGVRIDLLPEVTEIQMFDFLKKLIVSGESGDLVASAASVVGSRLASVTRDKNVPLAARPARARITSRREYLVS